MKLFTNLINQYPFYQRVRNLWAETQNEQILKGLHKYPEAFNPRSWTPEQLLKHALQESVDQVTYLVGLMELIEDMEKKIARLEGRNKELEAMLQTVQSTLPEIIYYLDLDDK